MNTTAGSCTEQNHVYARGNSRIKVTFEYIVITGSGRACVAMFSACWPVSLGNDEVEAVVVWYI